MVGQAARKPGRNQKSNNTTRKDQLKKKRPKGANGRQKLSSGEQFFKALGPGLITGASDDDPSGIATYSTAGAQFGFATLWTSVLTYPLLATVEYTCAKIALVQGKGLESILKQHYHPMVLFAAVSMLLFANTVNAGADLGAIAAAMNLLLPAVPPIYFVLPITVTIVCLQIFGSYALIARTFKWLSLSLLAYVGTAFFVNIDWRSALLSTVVPTIKLDREFVAMLVAILGTTISPYLFFWQADEEIEEEKANGNSKSLKRHGVSLRKMRGATLDVMTGMFFSNLVMYFIVLTTGATLHKAGITNVESASQAAEALKPLAGEGATILFALGLIGTGFLAVPILTGSSAYALAAVFNWKAGLNEKFSNAKQFYTAIAVSTLIGMSINFLHINPIQALVWTAIVNGVLAPPLLLAIMLIANNKKIMGKHTNSLATNFLGWTATALMFAAAAALGWTTFFK